MNLPYRVSILSPPGVNLEALWRDTFLDEYLRPGPASDLDSAPRLRVVCGSPDTPPESLTPSAGVLAVNQSRLTITAGQGATLLAPAATLAHGDADVRQLFFQGVSHAFARQGGAILHAAAVAFAGQSILILGLSRSGKSTLATLVLRAGGRIVSDDLLLVGLTAAREVQVDALRKPLFLRAPTHGLLPEALFLQLQPMIMSGERRWRLERDATAATLRSLTPDRLICSTVDHALTETRVQSLPKANALAEVIRAASPLFLSPGYPEERSAMLPALTQLATDLTCFRVDLGHDLLAQPDATLARLLRETA